MLSCIQPLVKSRAHKGCLNSSSVELRGCCPHIPHGTRLAERRLWVGWALADCSSPTTTEKWKQHCWEHSAGCHLKYENVGVASLSVFLGPSHAWHSQAHFKDNIPLARTSMNSKGMEVLAKRGLQWTEVGWELQLMLINYKFIFLYIKIINRLTQASQEPLRYTYSWLWENICTNVSIEAPTGTGNVLQLLIRCLL